MPADEDPTTHAARCCARCGHHSDWHRLNDALNVGPLDPGARFRCLGGSHFGGCSHGCPGFVAPAGRAARQVEPS